MSSRRLLAFIHFLIGCTFFVPLLVVPAQFIFPFIVPKILFFRSLTVLMAGGYILLLAFHWEEFWVRRTGVTLAVVAFIGSFAVSTFVGVDWYRSFWDNHERMLGLFTLFHYFLYYLVVTSVIREWREWRFFLRLFLLAGGLVMFIALLQKGSPELLLNRGAARVSSTLGNPIYVGGYGLFLGFLGCLLFLREKANAWRVYAATGAVLGFLGIFLSGTRGSVVGLCVGVWVGCLAYAITLKEHRRARQICAGLIAGSVLLLVILFLFRASPAVRNIPALGPLLNTSVAIGDSAGTRILAWGIAFDAWRERPIFGWGPNNYYYAFNKYYRPKFLAFGWGETWFDNAHNIIVNTLAVQGIVGLGIYLFIFGSAIWTMWRRQQSGALDIHVANIGAAFLVAHLVQNIFVFENPTSYLYFFFFLAFLNGQTMVKPAGSEKLKPAEADKKKPSVAIISTVAAMVVFILYTTNVNPARANMATLQVIQGAYQGRNAVEEYRQSSAIPSPHIDDIRNDFARTAFELLPRYVEAKRSEEARALFQLAYEELNKNLLLHPRDIRVHIQQAQLVQYAAQLTQDPKWFLVAEELLGQALTYSPKRQQIQYLLSGTKAVLGRNDEAIKLMRESIDNEPTVDEGWWRLALLYQDLGQITEARKLLAEAEGRGIQFSGTGAEVARSILASSSTTGTRK
ncbi:MAG: O-antigen ligase family protein [Candidatus Magasanikbacteria bacterium]|nr:O-antigen ligase family protein [Candidatus Magasanikbacteria bacterium]